MYFQYSDALYFKEILIEEGKAITLQTYRDARKKLLSVFPNFRGDFTLEVLKPYILLE